MKEKIKLLAVDLAWSGKTGYAIINQDFDILEVDVFKCHAVRKKDPIQDSIHSKVWQIFNFAKDIITISQPTHVYYEVSNWCMSPKAVAGLNNAQASFVMGHMMVSKAPLISMTPNEWQTELGINKGKRVKGKERKAKTAKIVCEKYGLLSFRDTGQALFGSRALSFDETDALAIAYVAMNRIKNEVNK